MEIVGRGERGRARRKPRGGAVYREIHRAFENHEHLFMHMTVRRMRRRAGRQFGFVDFQGEAGVQLAIQNRARLVEAAGAARLDREFVEFISFREKRGGGLGFGIDRG